MLPMVFVFYWMLSLSLKPQIEATAYPPSFIRFSLTLAGYREVFTKYPFFLYTWNSLVVAAGLHAARPGRRAAGRVLHRALGAATAWPLGHPGGPDHSRDRVPDPLVHLLPVVSGWWTPTGRSILTHLIVGLPIIIWVMISFFEDVPADLEDAGLIDGCSHLGVFWRIALPLVKPGVVATAILSFVFSWNNFLFSVILAGRSTRTLPIAVYNMISFEEINWGTLAAAATLITLPVLLVALLAQRHIVTGLTFGAVKQ